MKKIYFATNNNFKLREASGVFANTGITILPANLDIIEPQSNDPVEISQHKAREAFRLIKKPIIVDDAGLFVTSLHGFPGTLTSPIMKMLSIPEFCKLLSDGDAASFRTTVTYNDGTELITVTGEVHGTLRVAHGAHATLLSDIFIPEGESSKTLTDLAVEGAMSHRRIALEKLLEKLLERTK